MFSCIVRVILFTLKSQLKYKTINDLNSVLDYTFFKTRYKIFKKNSHDLKLLINKSCVF